MASKSESTQYKYREVSVDPVVIHGFANDERLGYGLAHNDELLDLIQDLSEKIKFFIDTKLTDRQKQIIDMLYFQGLTQTETAKILGLCQPTIHKVAFGNAVYSKESGKVETKRYGGAIKKLRKICQTDNEIVSLMARIDKIKTDLQDAQ